MKSPFILLLFLFFWSGPTLGQTIFGTEEIIIDDSELLWYPVSVRSGDIDNDGDEDLIYSNYFDNYSTRIIWQEVLADGALGDQHIIDSPSQSISDMQLADVDNDGDLDILFVIRSLNRIGFYRNNGSGVFGDQEIITSSYNAAQYLEVADLDQDGNVDLVVSGYDGQRIKWYSNNGNGAFAEESTLFNYGNYGYAPIKIADMDNDGMLDIVIASITFDRVSVFYQTALGQFSSEQEIATSVDRITSMSLDEMNGDGLVDIVLAFNYVNHTVQWIENLSGGLYGSPQTILPGAYYPGIDVQTLDLDNDGDIDILSSSQDIPNAAYTLWNDGSGNFSDLDTFIDFGQYLTSIYPGDFNGDGQLDLACTFENGIGLYRGNNTGSYELDEYDSGIGVNRVADLEMADLNNDGFDDLVSISKRDRRLAVYSNTGDGSFGEQIQIANFSGIPQTVDLSDIDGDDDIDIVVAAAAKGVVWFENNGGGTFQPEQQVSLVGSGSSCVRSVDLDNDNDLDLIANLASLEPDQPNYILTLRNQGSGVFEVWDTITTTGTLGNFLISDLDNDGLIDIVLLKTGYSDISWSKNAGGGSFLEPILLSSEFLGVATIRVMDIDNDNDEDILFVNRWDTPLRLHENLGGGNFGTLDSIDLVVRNVFNGGDLDNDGDIDLVYKKAGVGSGTYVWAENDGSGNLTEVGYLPSTNATGKVSHDLVIHDLDNDNDLDVVGHFNRPSKLFLHENLLELGIATIQGQVYKDMDGDSVYTIGDIPLEGVLVTVEPIVLDLFTDANGFYEGIVPGAQPYTITMPVPRHNSCGGLVAYDLVTPDSNGVIIEPSADDTLELDFVWTEGDDPCRMIYGVVFDDINENGVRDIGEGGASSIKVRCLGYGFVYSDLNGEFQFNVPKDEDVVVFLNLNAGFSYCGNSTNMDEQTLPFNNDSIWVEASAESDSVLFGVMKRPLPDYEVGLYSLAVNAGNSGGKRFNAWMDFKASGNITQNCTLRITHNPALEMQSSSIPVTNTGDEFVEWVFPPGTAPAFHCMQMVWYLDSVVVEGSTLVWEATYGCPDLEDACPYNNTIVTQVVVVLGNGRMADHETTLYALRPEGEMPEFITRDDQAFSYFLMFQNPMDVVARDLIIIDQLPDVFDINTVSQPFSSFMGYEFNAGEDGLLVWEMNGIDLSVVSEDELNSYGFVQFNVRLKDDLPDGTVIPNSAELIYNMNAEVNSNETVQRISVESSVFDNQFAGLRASVYPNPFSSATTFEMNKELPFNYDVRLYNILGSQESEYLNNSGRIFDIDRQGLTPGIYFINIYESGKSEVLGSLKVIAQ